MFSKAPLGGGGRTSGARVGDGPTPIPRDEKLQLRGSAERKEEDTPVGASSADDAEATRSLLFLSTQAACGAGEKTNGSNSTATALSASATSSDQPTNDASVSGGLNNGATPPSAPSAQNGGTTQQLSTSSDAWFGQALEYAAGVAFRTHVLHPVLEKPLPEELTFAMRTEAPRFLGSYSSGKVVLFKNTTTSKIEEASVQRITHQDAPVLASWWEHDKVLSYTSPEWSDWWVRRCHSLDPGCEMLKLVDENGYILGVVYYERNIVDHHFLESGESTRTTLLRGIRLAPSINPEVIRRSSMSDSETFPKVQYKGISSLLFCHVLFMSVRYGSQCVGLYSPKSEVAERFYESFMGKPKARNEVDGRLYYRMDSSSRWTILQQAFRRQISLWIKREGGVAPLLTPLPKESGETETTIPENQDRVSKAVEPAGDEQDGDGNGEIGQDSKRRRVEEPSSHIGEDPKEKDSEDDNENVGK